MKISLSAFFGAAFGTMIEYYDYALMTIFLPIVSPLFFPADSIYQSLVRGYWMLMLAMLMRPLGGIAFGYLGDTFGRRKALLTSMYGIALSTLAIGVMPTCAVWGIGATVLVVIAKSVQMFCFGGEYNGAGIYVVEHARDSNESFMSGLLTAIMLAGSLIASLMGVALTTTSMPSWSWRMAFILGSLIGILAIAYRKDLVESPVFKPADKQLQNLKNLIKIYPTELLAGFFIGGFATFPFTTVFAFINPILMATGHMSNHQLMIQQTLLLCVAVIALAISGKLADYFSTKKLMQWGCLLLLVTAYPLLLIIDRGQWIFWPLSLMIIANEMLLAPANAYLKNLFAVEYRYRAASLSFCLGLSLIGGLTPLIENRLYRLTGHFQTIAVWLVIMSGATILSLYLVERKQRAISSALQIQLSE